MYAHRSEVCISSFNKNDFADSDIPKVYFVILQRLSHNNFHVIKHLCS